MKNKFWFWYDIGFSLWCVFWGVRAFVTDSSLFLKVLYPTLGVVLLFCAYVMWKVDQDERS